MVESIEAGPVDVMGWTGAGKGGVGMVEKGGRIGEVAAG